MTTPLVPAPRLARGLGLEALWAKCEQANPSGFHKDRSSRAMVAEAQAQGRRGLTVGTCGSAGLALARLAAQAGLAAVVFVPARYRGAPLEAMQALGAQVVRTPGTYEDAVAASAALAAAERLYDANPTGVGGSASLLAYEAIADEIVGTLETFPDTVWVPAGNGTTLAGVARGFARLARAAGRPPPRVCGVGSDGNTAVIASILAGRVVLLDPAALRETPANEPLLNWRSAHAAEALGAVAATGGTGYAASDAELFAMAARLAADGIAATPAGAAGLAGLAATAPTGGLHVVVLTA